MALSGLTTRYSLSYPLSTDVANLLDDVTAMIQDVDSTLYENWGPLSNVTFANIAGAGSAITSLTAGNLGGTIPSAVLGNSSVFIGTTSIALNRASAALTLAGLTLTTPTIDSVVSSAAGATNTLWSATTTGSIAIGAGLTTGALNLASVGTGVTVITVGHTNSTIALIGAVTVTGSLTATLTGNASTATALQNARTINGTSFNGTANITVTADASTLTSTTLNATVVTSSLTSVGTITSGIWNAGAVTSSGGISGTTGTFSSNVSMTQLSLNRQDAVNEGGEVVFKRASDNATGFIMDLYGGGTTPGVRLFNAGATNLWYFNNDGTTILPGNLQTNFVADTATAATHYFVEIGTDGYVRPKTLANVKTEIVTTAAVNSAAATTVGTITSGIWNAGAVTSSGAGVFTSTISASGLAGALLSSATPLVESGAGTPGTSTIPSRQDHVHPADGGGGGGTAVGFEASFFLMGG